MQREQDFYDRSILIPSDDVAHTHLRKTTHPLHAVPWVDRVWASYRVKSVSFYLASKHIGLYASCFSLFKPIKDIESFELFYFISLKSQIKFIRLRRTLPDTRELGPQRFNLSIYFRYSEVSSIILLLTKFTQGIVVMLVFDVFTRFCQLRD